MDATSVEARLVSAIAGAADQALGHALSPGTTVVGSPDRAKSTMAVAYPLGDRTIVWCSPVLQARLAPLNDPRPMHNDEFADRCERLGGVVTGVSFG